MSGKTVKLNIKPNTIVDDKGSKTIKELKTVKPKPKTTPKKQKSEYRVKAEDYQTYDRPKDHIYNITDTYIGSDEKMPRHERVLNLETLSFQEEEITLPVGVERIFVEISSNSGDNVARSLRHGVDPKEVTIVMNKEIISIRNGGIPIPVEMHKTKNMWAPQVIFGVLFSSSNYNKNNDKNKVRTECGRNGYGAKLTNIFSKQFMITIGDPHNKRWYRQIWNNNMDIMSEPEIKENYAGESFVEVVYKMDFERFGYTEYPEEAFRLFARHAADMSFTGKIPVSFNGIKLNVQNSQDYAKLYFPEVNAKNSLVFYQWPVGSKTTTDKKGLVHCKTNGTVPMIEICAVDTPDNSINVSFVNGMWTKNGGVHADASFKAIASGILNTVNGTDNSNSKNKKKKKKKSMFKLNYNDVKRHISIFVSCWIGDPKFDSQSKTALTSPTPKITVNEKILKPIMNWDLLNRLYAELEAKHFKATLKSDGKKCHYLADIKGEDANWAGKSKSLECTLYVTEGKSAMSFAVKMISLYDKGRDTRGVLPLKGKPLNVMNAQIQQISENSEIAEIKKMTGIRENVDYSKPENFKTLRYGNFVVLADADKDGKHILGLVLNLFHCRYPSLLKIGYVKYLRTKILDVKKGKKNIKFYTNHEYEQWRDRTPGYESWDHSYFKGLGSSKDSDIAEEFENPKFVSCIYDEIAPNTMRLAFHKTMADQRKAWLQNWVPDFKVETMKDQPITSFINHEFIQYSLADVARSIPRFMDGLKVGQRKIIWASKKRWGAKVGASNAKEVKVGNLASYASDAMGYHHGETCLSDTIVKMAHEFTGTNNLPPYYSGGQFGCVDPKTPIILWDNKTVLAENVKLGDELIGDDGKKRTVLKLVSGIDDMYRIDQTFGDSYTVNSIHILTLIVPSHKKIEWSENKQTWVMNYYDRKTKKIVTIFKNYKEDFGDILNEIDNDNTVDIPLNEYLKLSEIQKSYLFGYKCFESFKNINKKYKILQKYSKIKVTKLEKGKYCGWHIDGNERFLLGDYTVTHNTRNMLGKDASKPRYIFTKPEWWWNLIYKKEDNSLLKMVIDEGEEYEPVSLLPILPMQLINGIKGIGTGHSSFIPNHDPLDICNWLLSKIDNKPLPPLLPWYRGFIGTIKITERASGIKSKKTKTIKNVKENDIKQNLEENKTESVDSAITDINKDINKNLDKDIKKDINKNSFSFSDNETDEESETYENADFEDDTENINKNTKYTMNTLGKYEVIGNKRKKIIVTEIPIGRCQHDYNNWLEKQRADKKISGFVNHSKANTVRFEITGMKNPSYKNLKLIKSFGISNMVLLDMNNKPVKFTTSYEMMEAFYAMRLPYYNLRKRNVLIAMKDKINLLNNKIKFIYAVINGYNLMKTNPKLTPEQAVANKCIISMGLKKKSIVDQMTKLGFPEDLLKKVTLYQCTLEEIENARTEYTLVVNKINAFQKILPSQMWKDDIEAFITAYCKHYKCKRNNKPKIKIKLNTVPKIKSETKPNNAGINNQPNNSGINNQPKTVSV